MGKAGRKALIESIHAREVLDSRGRPMVEVDLVCGDGARGTGSFPCGTSTGSEEAFVLRDGGPRYDGLGVLRAVRNVEEAIAPALKGMSVRDQRGIDERLLDLDGTPDKSRLGANALYSVSMAAARAGAGSLGLPLYRYLAPSADAVAPDGAGILSGGLSLPVPLLNLLNGGHYGALRVDIQEHMLAPVGAGSYAEALRMGVEVFYRLHELIRERYGAERLLTGHSAGDAAVSNEPEENIELLLGAAEGAGYGGRFRVALDCAASHFHDHETGLYRFRGRSVSRDELIRFLLDLLDRYPIFLVEDPLDEEDFEGFAEITRLARAGGAAGKAGRAGVLIAGDDLFVTSRARLERGIERGAANALVFKPNMVGTITEALDCALLARRSGYTLVPSVRAGGSVDDPVPDLAVALSAPLIKAGAPRSGERTSYHNRLMRIEEEGEGTIRLSPILG